MFVVPNLRWRCPRGSSPMALVGCTQMAADMTVLLQRMLLVASVATAQPCPHPFAWSRPKPLDCIRPQCIRAAKRCAPEQQSSVHPNASEQQSGRVGEHSHNSPFPMLELPCCGLVILLLQLLQQSCWQAPCGEVGRVGQAARAGSLEKDRAGQDYDATLFLNMQTNASQNSQHRR